VYSNGSDTAIGISSRGGTCELEGVVMGLDVVTVVWPVLGLGAVFDAVMVIWSVLGLGAGLGAGLDVVVVCSVLGAGLDVVVACSVLGAC